MYIGMYRPFSKKNFYYHANWTDQQYKMTKVMPESTSENLMIAVSNKTERKNFSCLMVNVLPDVNLFAGGSQNLPMFLYDEIGQYSAIRKDMLEKFNDLEEEDVLYYIYGIFHSRDYRETYHDDLAKTLPRILNVRNKNEIIELGRKLSEIHLNYETVLPYSELNIRYNSNNPSFLIQRMKHPKIKDENGNNIDDTSRIIYNKDIIVENIPQKAYDYEVNGKSAIAWIMDQYKIKNNSSDNPNLYSDNPKYIFNLLLSIINVSVQTVDLMNSLPPLEIIEE